MIRSKKNSSKREKDNSARVTYLDQQQQQVNDIGSVDSDTNFDQLIAKHSSTILKATVPDTNYGELADEASARGLRISRKMKHLMEKKDKEWYNYKIINEPQFDFQNPSQIPYRYVMTNQDAVIPFNIVTLIEGITGARITPLYANIQVSRQLAKIFKSHSFQSQVSKLPSKVTKQLMNDIIIKSCILDKMQRKRENAKSTNDLENKNQKEDFELSMDILFSGNIVFEGDEESVQRALELYNFIHNGSGHYLSLFEEISVLNANQKHFPKYLIYDLIRHKYGRKLYSDLEINIKQKKLINSKIQKYLSQNQAKIEDGNNNNNKSNISKKNIVNYIQNYHKNLFFNVTNNDNNTTKDVKYLTQNKPKVIAPVSTMIDSTSTRSNRKLLAGASQSQALSNNSATVTVKHEDTSITTTTDDIVEDKPIKIDKHKLVNMSNKVESMSFDTNSIVATSVSQATPLEETPLVIKETTTPLPAAIPNAGVASNVNDLSLNFRVYGTLSNRKQFETDLSNSLENCFSYMIGDLKMQLILYKFPWLFHKIEKLTKCRVWQDDLRPGLLWIHSNNDKSKQNCTLFLNKFVSMIDLKTIDKEYFAAFVGYKGKNIANIVDKSGCLLVTFSHGRERMRKNQEKLNKVLNFNDNIGDDNGSDGRNNNESKTFIENPNEDDTALIEFHEAPSHLSRRQKERYEMMKQTISGTPKKWIPPEIEYNPAWKYQILMIGDKDQRNEANKMIDEVMKYTRILPDMGKFRLGILFRCLECQHLTIVNSIRNKQKQAKIDYLNSIDKEKIDKQNREKRKSLMNKLVYDNANNEENNMNVTKMIAEKFENSDNDDAVINDDAGGIDKDVAELTLDDFRDMKDKTNNVKQNVPQPALMERLCKMFNCDVTFDGKDMYFYFGNVTTAGGNSNQDDEMDDIILGTVKQKEEIIMSKQYKLQQQRYKTRNKIIDHASLIDEEEIDNRFNNISKSLQSLVEKKYWNPFDGIEEKGKQDNDKDDDGVKVDLDNLKQVNKMLAKHRFLRRNLLECEDLSSKIRHLLRDGCYSHFVTVKWCDEKDTLKLYGLPQMIKLFVHDLQYKYLSQFYCESVDIGKNNWRIIRGSNFETLDAIKEETNVEIYGLQRDKPIIVATKQENIDMAIALIKNLISTSTRIPIGSSSSSTNEENANPEATSSTTATPTTTVTTNTTASKTDTTDGEPINELEENEVKDVVAWYPDKNRLGLLRLYRKEIQNKHDCELVIDNKTGEFVIVPNDSNTPATTIENIAQSIHDLLETNQLLRFDIRKFMNIPDAKAYVLMNNERDRKSINGLLSNLSENIGNVRISMNHNLILVTGLKENVNKANECLTQCFGTQERFECDDEQFQSNRLRTRIIYDKLKDFDGYYNMKHYLFWWDYVQNCIRFVDLSANDTLKLFLKDGKMDDNKTQKMVDAEYQVTNAPDGSEIENTPEMSELAKYQGFRQMCQLLEKNIREIYLGDQYLILLQPNLPFELDTLDFLQQSTFLDNMENGRNTASNTVSKSSESRLDMIQKVSGATLKIDRNKGNLLIFGETQNQIALACELINDIYKNITFFDVDPINAQILINDTFSKTFEASKKYSMHDPTWQTKKKKEKKIKTDIPSLYYDQSILDYIGNEIEVKLDVIQALPTEMCKLRQLKDADFWQNVVNWDQTQGYYDNLSNGDGDDVTISGNGNNNNENDIVSVDNVPLLYVVMYGNEQRAGMVKGLLDNCLTNKLDIDSINPREYKPSNVNENDLFTIYKSMDKNQQQMLRNVFGFRSGAGTGALSRKQFGHEMS